MGAGSVEIEAPFDFGSWLLPQPRRVQGEVFQIYMGSPIIAPPLAGSVIGSVGSDFVVAEWKDAGGLPGAPRWIAPLHLHRNDDEAWYVLEGTLCVRVGTDDVEARAGSGVFVPRGTPHTYWNPGPGPARYLLVMTSNVYSLIQDIHRLTERSPEALRAVFERHESELLG